MSAPAPSFDNSLEAAASQMRNLFQDGETLPSWFDRGSVGRILVHIDNIGRSVLASPQDHVNAAKRLNDFALIFARFARDCGPPEGPLAARMSSVSDNLRAASQNLSSANAHPVQRSAAHDHRQN